MDFIAANHVPIVRLCKSVKNAKAHRVDIIAIAQLSCSCFLCSSAQHVYAEHITDKQFCLFVTCWYCVKVTALLLCCIISILYSVFHGVISKAVFNNSPNGPTDGISGNSVRIPAYAL